MRCCSRYHYDAKCKSISVPGLGSFLHGWAVQLHDKASVTDQVTHQQIDTLIKVLEADHNLSPDEKKRAFGLGIELRRAFGRLHEAAGLQKEVDEV